MPWVHHPQLTGVRDGCSVGASTSVQPQIHICTETTPSKAEEAPSLRLLDPAPACMELSWPIQITTNSKNSYVLFQFSSPSVPPLPCRNQAQGQPMWAPGEMSSVRHTGPEPRGRLAHGELKAVSIITQQAPQSPEMGKENPRGCLQSKGRG